MCLSKGSKEWSTEDTIQQVRIFALRITAVRLVAVNSGIAIGGDPGSHDDETLLIRKAGKVSNLAETIKGWSFN